MKQRSKWLKPRVWIPLLALLLFYIGCGVYVLVAGRVNTVSVIISEKEYVAGSQTAVSSDERVMRVTQIKEELMDDGSLTLSVEAEFAGTGEATLLHTFEMTDQTGGSFEVSPVKSEYVFYATPFGLLYNKTFRHFNGNESLLILAVGTMLIVSAACVFSVIEKYRCGDFSYSMVVRCGLIIFLTVNAMIVIFRWIEMLRINGVFEINYIIGVLFNSAKTFVTLSALPLTALALALALSNVQLVRHEGFRVMNLLGIFIGIVMMGGIAVLRWLNNHLVYASLETYYFSNFTTWRSPISMSILNVCCCPPSSVRCFPHATSRPTVWITSSFSAALSAPTARPRRCSGDAPSVRLPLNASSMRTPDGTPNLYRPAVRAATRSSVKQRA